MPENIWRLVQRLENTIDKFEAENKRLREALQYIELHARNNLVQSTAREALKEKQ